MRSSGSRPFLSLAILAYNEEWTIENAVRVCAQVLDSCGRSYELVLVDDGSTDRTREIMEDLASSIAQCRTIIHPKNFGIGAGIRTCYFGTTGEWATWFPADLQADPRELPRLLNLLADCDVLVTYRDPSKRQGGWNRRFVSVTDRNLVRLLFGLSLRDLHWIRFFRRDVLNCMRLSCRSPFVDTEMILQARRHGAKILEAPLAEHPRRFGSPSGASLSHVGRALRDVVGLRLRGIRLASEGQIGTLPAHEDPSWLVANNPAR